MKDNSGLICRAETCTVFKISNKGDSDVADTQERVAQLLIRQFNISESDVNPETSFLDLTDSFGMVELAVAVEKEFQCSIRDDEEAYAIENVGQLVSYLNAPR